jgi:hypothetical protein
MDLYEVILGRKLINNKNNIKFKKDVIKTDKTKYKLNLYKEVDKLNNDIKYNEEEFKKII